jgi:hypothetical protein
MKSHYAWLTAVIIFTSAIVHAQTADEIISKYIAAIGGKEAWQKITSLKEEGNLDANGTQIGVQVIAVHNKGYRSNISLSGLTGYVIETPSNGWSYFPWQGHIKAEAMTPEDLKEAQDDLDVQGSLLDYKEKGHSAEFVGMDDFEGTECYKIRLNEKSGKVVTYYIDPSNYFLIHSVTITKANGQENTSSSDYSNYTKLPEGIWIPFNVSSFGSPFKIKKVEVNTQVDESVFKPATN